MFVITSIPFLQETHNVGFIATYSFPSVMGIWCAVHPKQNAVLTTVYVLALHFFFGKQQSCVQGFYNTLVIAIGCKSLDVRNYINKRRDRFSLNKFTQYWLLYTQIISMTSYLFELLGWHICDIGKNMSLPSIDTSRFKD